MLCNCVEDLGCFLAGDPINFGLNALCDGTFTFEVSRRGLIERIEIDFVAGDPLILPNSFDEHGEIKVKIKFPEACADPTNGVSYVTSTRGACVFKFKNEVPVCSGGSPLPCPDPVPVPLAPIAATAFKFINSGGVPFASEIVPADTILPEVYQPTIRITQDAPGTYTVNLDPPRLIGAPYIDYFGPLSPEGSFRTNNGFNDGEIETKFEVVSTGPYQLTFSAGQRPFGSLDPFEPVDFWGDPDQNRFFVLVLTDFEGQVGENPINVNRQ